MSILKKYGDQCARLWKIGSPTNFIASELGLSRGQTTGLIARLQRSGAIAARKSEAAKTFGEHLREQRIIALLGPCGKTDPVENGDSGARTA